MKKVILIPDSFKGTMSSAEICTVMAQEVQEYYPDAQVHSCLLYTSYNASAAAWMEPSAAKYASRSPIHRRSSS